MAQGTQLLGCVYLYPTAVRNLSHICVCVWPFGSVSKPLINFKKITACLQGWVSHILVRLLNVEAIVMNLDLLA